MTNFLSPFAASVHRAPRRARAFAARAREAWYRHPAKTAALLSAVCAALLLSAVPFAAHASVGSILVNVTYTIIGKIFFAVSYIIAFIAGIAIALEAWFVGALLQMNMGIVNSTPVQVGFAVTLSVANLGFVLGIIVIAIATIIRQQTYGIKQILWKLVVAALLVNFSLVISGAILGFTNDFAMYFLEHVNPAGSVGNAANGVASFSNFASSLAGAFNPQKGFASLNVAVNDNTAEDQKISGALGTAAQGLGQLLVPIVSLFFVLAMLIVIAITLAAFVIMLIVRYVTIGILMIVMPLAWLMWVFPHSKHLWTKWWNEFIRWSFFAPISLFFLFLVIKTGASISQGTETGSLNMQQYSSSSNPVWASIVNIFTNFFAPAIQALLQQAMMVALAIGGLYIANKLSIHGADWGMKSATSVGDSFKGYAKRRSQQVWGRVYHGSRLQRLATGLATNQVGGQSRSRIVRGVTLPIRFAGQKLGAGLQSLGVAGMGGMVEEAKGRMKKAIAGATPDQAKNLIPGAPAPDQIALLDLMHEKGWLNKTDIGQYAGSDKEELFERFGQGKLHEEIAKATGGVAQAGGAAEAIAKGGEQAKVTETYTGPDGKEQTRQVLATEKLGASVSELAQSLKKGDKLEANDIFGGKAAFGLSEAAMTIHAKELAKALFKENRLFIPKLIPQLTKKESFENFREWYGGVVEQSGDDTTKKEWQQMIANNAVFFYEPPSNTGGGAPPPQPQGENH